MVLKKRLLGDEKRESCHMRIYRHKSPFFLNERELAVSKRWKWVERCGWV